MSSEHTIVISPGTRLFLVNNYNKQIFCFDKCASRIPCVLFTFFCIYPILCDPVSQHLENQLMSSISAVIISEG